jgi:hypothetical protein
VLVMLRDFGAFDGLALSMVEYVILSLFNILSRLTHLVVEYITS